MEKFSALGLSETSIRTLEKKGFKVPTDIQEKTIPLLLKENKNVIAQARTGTGKTAAFGLVFVEKLLAGAKDTQALVLTPTRELAIQVAEEIDSLKGDKKLRTAVLYGGQNITIQFRQLKLGADIVIGTPGRVMDHLRQKTLNIKHLKYFVLDEADEMLNMGFIEDIETIFKETNKEKQLLLFSATMPKRIISLVKNYISDHVLIKGKEQDHLENPIEQIYYELREKDKFEALCRVIDVQKSFYGIIFCRTKLDVDDLTKLLKDRGFRADALHGDIVQNQREKILKSFKTMHTKILVATDVAARGIDVNNLTHVLNYSLPENSDIYVHRIGRTGRAGKDGNAITFVTPKEAGKFKRIISTINKKIRRELLPSADQIITAKKDRITEKIKNIIDNEPLDFYLKNAESFFGEYDKNIVIAALMKYAFHKELNIKDMSNVIELNLNDRKSHGNDSDQRLFIKLGKKDKMGPKDIINIISEYSGVRKSDINELSVMENFSFVTVSYDDAQKIIDGFKNTKNGKRIPVEIANKVENKDRKSKNRNFDKKDKNYGKKDKREKKGKKQKILAS